MARGNVDRLVAKFGGKSLRDGDLILKAAGAVKRELERGRQVIVVVSAVGEMTDHLLRLVRGATEGKAKTWELDDVLSMGERMSAKIFTSALNSLGVKARSFDPSNEAWPIVTDERYEDANPVIDECSHKIRDCVLPLLRKGIVPVFPGFIGRSRNGNVTTLGRGGSDITALLISQSVGAREVVLITDVDGIMTADPKLVNRPRLIERMTVKDLAGLADRGTKFIHGKALKYKDDSVDLRIVNYRHGKLDGSGTVITGSFPLLDVELAEREPVMAITFVGKMLMKSPAIIAEIMNRLGEHGAAILGLGANRDSATVYLQSKDGDLLKDLHAAILGHEEAMAIAVRENLALVKVKGVGLEEMPGIVGRIGDPLRQHNVNIFDMFTITSSIMVLVDWDDRHKVIRLLKRSLRETPC